MTRWHYALLVLLTASLFFPGLLIVALLVAAVGLVVTLIKEKS